MTDPLSDVAQYHLSLSNAPLEFDASGGQAYWNTKNREMVVIGDTLLTRYTKVAGQPTQHNSLSIQNKGRPIHNVLFSPSHQYIVIQRSPVMVEFTFIEESRTFNINVKKSGAADQSILGIHWYQKNNLMIITRKGVEVYKCVSGAGPKLVKHSSILVHWYTYTDKNKIALICTGKQRRTIQGFAFKPDFFFKLPRVDLSEAHEKSEVLVIQIYDSVYMMLRDTSEAVQPKLHLYLLGKEDVRLACTLDLMVKCRVAINIVDNLIVVHNLDSRVSMLYDIRNEQPEFPVAGALAVAPVEDQPLVKMYSRWRYVAPNVVIDERAGCVWALELRVDDLAVAYTGDKETLVNFLVRRARSKTLVLEVIRGLIECQSPLVKMATVFEIINRVLGSLPLDLRNELGSGEVPPRTHWRNRPDLSDAEPDAQGVRTSRWEMVVSQGDMFIWAFTNLHTAVPIDYATSVLTEYLRSLGAYSVKVIPALCETLIELLVRNKQFHQLHLFVQHHVIAHSVPAANVLLEIAHDGFYLPARQLAFDMLYQLGNLDQLLLVLIRLGDVSAALRLITKNPQLRVQPKTLLDLAEGDTSLYHVVFRFFEEKSHSWPPEEIQRYSKLFPVVNERSKST